MVCYASSFQDWWLLLNRRIDETRRLRDYVEVCTLRFALQDCKVRSKKPLLLLGMPMKLEYLTLLQGAIADLLSALLHLYGW